MNYRFLAAGSLLLSLTACGGGGGSDAGKAVVTPAPVAVAPAPVVTTTVSGISSNDVETGGSLVVSGTNLDKVSSFQLAGVELKLVSVTPGTAVLTMPAAAASGTLTLVVAGASIATPHSLNVYLAPVVSGFAPSAGMLGSSVTVSGSGLESVTKLRFANGIVATVATPHSGASLTFLVPAGAASGSLTLVAAHKEIVTGAVYTVVSPATVTGLSSSSSGAYVHVVVVGNNLKTLKSAKVGNVDASVVSATDTQVVLSVPLGSVGIVSLSFSYGADVNAGTVVGDFTIGSVDFSEVYNRNVNDAALRLTPGRPAAVRASVLGVVPGQVSPAVSVTATSAGGVVLGTLSMKGPLLLPMLKNEADLNNTFNAVLPGAWMQAGVRVRIDVLATGGALSSQTAAPGVGSDAKIHIVLVPLVTDAGTSSLPDPAAVAAGLARTYPYAAGNITVTRRAPLLMPGSSTNYSWWSSSLSQLEAIRMQEDATAFYYGFTSGPSSDNVAGLGYVPDRASGRGATSALGLDVGATDIGATDPFGNVWPEWLTVLLHEVGHNHSLKHIACGPVANADLSYPYPNGDLGPQPIYSSAYGDTQLGRLSQPMATTANGTYERMKDVMSYCGGVWFSDFSYVRAQQFAEAHTALNAPASPLVAKATKAASGNGYLSISGSIDTNGVQLRAPVASSARPAMPAGRTPYILRVLTVAGQTLDLPFDVTEVGDGKGNASHFWVSLDNPGEIASIDVLLNGKVLPQAAARVVAAKLVAGARAPASLDWTLLNGRLELRWNAVAEPFLSVLHIAANGVKTVLATNLGGGGAALDVRALPAGGQFEVSLATSLKARLVSIPQP